MILVCNASPLIVLAKAGLLDLLTGLCAGLRIPRSVAEEVSRINDPADPARIWLLRNNGFVADSPSVSPFVMAWDLGAGESSVISLVESLPGLTAVLDDLAGRRCAQAIGLPVVGTLGLILMAKQRGLISSVRPALDSIVAAGLFISRHHIDSILTQAGESSPPPSLP
jgi:predicted nucleic acid-binding protein